jgi:hypothetical protein
MAQRFTDQLIMASFKKVTDIDQTKPFYQVQPINTNTAKIVEVCKLEGMTCSIFVCDAPKTCLPKKIKAVFVSCLSHDPEQQLLPIVQLNLMKNNTIFAYLSYNFVKKDKLDEHHTGHYNVTYHENHKGTDKYSVVVDKVEWVNEDTMFSTLIWCLD